MSYQEEVKTARQIIDDAKKNVNEIRAQKNVLSSELKRQEWGVDKDLINSYMNAAGEIEERMNLLAGLMDKKTLDMTDVAAMQILNSQITNLTAASNLMKKAMEKAAEMAQQR